MSKKPRRYEITPFRMFMPGVPTPGPEALPTAPPEDDDEYHWPKEIPVIGMSTLPTCLEDARREAEELLRRCRHQLREGKRSAIWDLLDLNPEFICVPWVRAELFRLLQGGLPLRKRGRPAGRYTVHPLVVIGLVEHLLATGQAANPEQAFWRLDDLQVLSHDMAKASYYRGLREKRLRSVLMEFPELRQVISAEEAAAAGLLNAEIVRPGKKITGTWEDPRLGRVEFTLKGR